MSYWEGLGKSNEWFTPPEVFQALGCTFDLDVAHPRGPTNVPCKEFLSAGALAAPWCGFVWMNPPFGGRNGIGPWLDRFFVHGNGIALTPDRTSAPWFQAAWCRADLVLFTRKLRFIRPDGSRGKSPSNGTALMAVGARGRDALFNAAEAGFGILAAPTARATISFGEAAA